MSSDTFDLAQAENDLYKARAENAKLRAKHSADQDAYHESLRSILLALDLGDHARPYSCAECVRKDVLPALSALRARVAALEGALKALLADVDATHNLCMQQNVMEITIGQFRRANHARAVLAAEPSTDVLAAARLEGERVGLERAAKAAESVVDGFTANIRISEDEQELVRDPDGPWVLNSDVAAAIRALTPTTIDAALAPPPDAVRPKFFPIQNGCAIPWAMIAQHEAQARTNHGQTLGRLAERGGLSATEAVAILDDRGFFARWPPKTWTYEAGEDEAKRILRERCDALATAEARGMERALAACEAIKAQDRNVGEDATCGYNGYKLGARDCASAIRALIPPDAARGEGGE